MRKLLSFSLLIAGLISCNTNNSLKEKELELKERELNLREKELAQKEAAEKTTKEQPKKSRKLRYLYFANGGLVGYFDDGTVAGCPRCDLLEANVENLYSEKPYSTYKIENGALVIKGRDPEYPVGNPTIADGWAMIDYKWQLKVPK